MRAIEILMAVIIVSSIWVALTRAPKRPGLLELYMQFYSLFTHKGRQGTLKMPRKEKDEWRMKVGEDAKP
jgi:hypothetical protein